VALRRGCTLSIRKYTRARRNIKGKKPESERKSEDTKKRKNQKK